MLCCFQYVEGGKGGDIAEGKEEEEKMKMKEKAREKKNGGREREERRIISLTNGASF